MKIYKHDNIIMYFNQIIRRLFPNDDISKNTAYGGDKDGNYIVVDIKIFYKIFFDIENNSYPIFLHNDLYIEVTNIIEGEEEDIVELTIQHKNSISDEYKEKLTRYTQIN